jgi:predicted PurR-regulated permease PerM
MNHKQIARVGALLLLCGLLYLIRNILFPIIIALVLYYILNPLVNILSGKRPKGAGLNRDLSILISFIVFILVLLAFFQFIIPPFADEFGQLVTNSPQYINDAQKLLESLRQWQSVIQLPKEISDVFSSMVQNVFSYIVMFVQQGANGLINLLSRIIYLVIIPIITYFILKDDKALARGAVEMMPKDHREFTIRILKKVNGILKNYINGQLIICTVVGLLAGGILYLIGVKFALILGMVAAIAQLIPNIGPFIGAIPALIIALLLSPMLALKVLLFYIVLNVIVMTIVGPKILGDKLNLHPLTVVISVLVFGELMGFWGLFFAAPITAILKVLYLEIRG